MEEITRQMKLLGTKVRDRVTGFSGVVASLSFDLYGCVQAVVTPPVDDKGEMKDGRWFDTSRLDVIDATPVMDLPSWVPRDVVVVAGDAPAAPVRGPESKPSMPSSPVR